MSSVVPGIDEIELIASGIPSEARDILDLCCGSGELGAAIKARQDCRVIGIEAHSALADEARNKLDQVVAGNVERIALPFPQKSFDAVIALGLFETVTDMSKLAAMIFSWLRPSGVLVTSINNSVNLRFLSAAIDGGWDYGPSGLLARNRIRLLTKDSLEESMTLAGFKSPQWFPRLDSELSEAREDQGGRVSMAFGSVKVTNLSRDEAENLSTSSYRCNFHRPRESSAPTAKSTYVADQNEVTMILVLKNQAPDAARLIETILSGDHDVDVRLVIVDNGSTDATAQLSSTTTGKVKVIHNPFDLGVVHALNQGAAEASGQFLLFWDANLEPDRACFRELLQPFREPRSTVAAVGARIVNPDGSVHSAGYDLVAGDGPARVNRRLEGSKGSDEQVGKRSVVLAVPGSAMVVRTSSFHAVGGFDEKLADGFEDVDLCLKLLEQNETVVYEPNAVATRPQGSSGGGLSPVQGKISRSPLTQKWASDPSTTGDV